MSDRYKGPSALGYEPGTRGWWDCAVRLNYRAARESLKRARYWSARLEQFLALSERKRTKYMYRVLSGALIEALYSAHFWRDQARHTRLARATRVSTLGPLKEGVS